MFVKSCNYKTKTKFKKKEEKRHDSRRVLWEGNKEEMVWICIAESVQQTLPGGINFTRVIQEPWKKSSGSTKKVRKAQRNGLCTQFSGKNAWDRLFKSWAGKRENGRADVLFQRQSGNWYVEGNSGRYEEVRSQINHYYGLKRVLRSRRRLYFCKKPPPTPVFFLLKLL